MWLNGKNIRGKSIKHPMGSDRYPAELDENELKSLVDRLMAGDDSVINRLCEGHYRLVISIASKYAWQAPGKEDDLVSEGFRGLVYAIRNARTKLKERMLTRWIAINVHRNCYVFLYREYLVKPGYGTYHRMRKEKREIKIPNVVNSLYVKKTSQETYEGGNDRNYTYDMQIGIRDDTVGDIKDVIDFLIKQEASPKTQELMKNIIHMRSMGYNDIEISKTLLVSTQYIHSLRHKIKRKYIRYISSLG